MSSKELEDYNEDSRTPCRYGDKCYQKNAAHLSKYKHPPKRIKRKNTLSQQKKIKLDNEEINHRLQSNEARTLNTADQEDTKPDKRETVSPSSSDHSNEATNPSESEPNQDDNQLDEPEIVDPKVFIKSKFLIQLPDDFYQFWHFCKEIRPSAPQYALKDVGLELVGLYDVLAGSFKNTKKSPEEYLRHWRYYFDPPEFFTVIKGDDKTGYHIGYFFDSPEESPSLLLSNHGIRDGVFSRMGDNIFAAVYLYLEELKRLGDPFKKVLISKILTQIKTKAEDLKLSLSSSSKKTRTRELKVVTNTHNKIGLVVPYNKKTQLGYRDLVIEDKDLMSLLTKLNNASPEQKAKFLSDLQPVLTYASIALDEFDFGTGVKLGWQLLYHGVDCLNSTIAKFLGNSYRLLNKESFAKIAEAHMKNRKKGSNLSIL